MLSVRAVALVLLAAMPAQAQNFEVASIRISGPKSVRGSDGGPGSSDPGRYTYGQATLFDLITVAWHLENFQISSRSPLDRDRFDLAAELRPETTKEQFRAMLRNFLAERFHLTTHMESRIFPGYALEVAKGGPKLTASSTLSEPAPKQWLQDGFPDLPRDRPLMLFSNTMAKSGTEVIRGKAQRQPMDVLARWLRQYADAPVVNKTGLGGLYDFILEFGKGLATDSSDADAPMAPDLNPALRKQLGLELVKERLPFDVVVVDFADRLPAAN